MTFKTMYFQTRQQALDYFNRVAMLSMAILAKDNGNNGYFVHHSFIFDNPEEERFFRTAWNWDMTLELCSE